MNLLLDTHILLWAAAEPGRLSAEAIKLINDENNKLYFSAASIWEVVIKNSLQRPDFKVDPHLLRRGLVDNGYLELPISPLHTLNVAHLLSLHKDPFDRILVAQAASEGFYCLLRMSWWLNIQARLEKYKHQISVVKRSLTICSF